MTPSEPGKDLSEPKGETKCFQCGVWVDDTDYNLHVSWHVQVQPQQPTYSNGYNAAGGNSPGYYSQLSFYGGMPMDQVIRQLADAIETIQRTIGTEGAYRFLRDMSRP